MVFIRSKKDDSVEAVKLTGELIPYQSLEELLSGLEKFGDPMVRKYERGWVVYVKMRVWTAGVGFEVSSDFRMPTPLAAARQCAERVLEVTK